LAEKNVVFQKTKTGGIKFGFGLSFRPVYNSGRHKPPCQAFETVFFEVIFYYNEENFPP